MRTATPSSVCWACGGSTNTLPRLMLGCGTCPLQHACTRCKKHPHDTQLCARSLDTCCKMNFVVLYSRHLKRLCKLLKSHAWPAGTEAGPAGLLQGFYIHLPGLAATGAACTYVSEAQTSSAQICFLISILRLCCSATVHGPTSADPSPSRRPSSYLLVATDSWSWVDTATVHGPTCASSSPTRRPSSYLSMATDSWSGTVVVINRHFCSRSPFHATPRPPQTVDTMLQCVIPHCLTLHYIPV